MTQRPGQFIIFSILLMMSALILKQSYGASETKLDRIKVIVNDEIITQKEIDFRIEKLKEEYLATKQAVPSQHQLRQLATDDLINEILQLQLAARVGIKINDAQLTDIIKGIASQNQMSLAQLKMALAQQGLPFKVYRKQIHDQYLISQVQRQVAGAKVLVTPAEVDRFIKSNDYRESAKLFNVSFVRLPYPVDKPTRDDVNKTKDLAKSLRKKLLSLKDRAFEKLDASTIGEDAVTGSLTPRRFNDFPELYQKPLKKLSVGGISEPIQAPNGIHLISLVSLAEPVDDVMTEQAKVRHIMMLPNEITGADEIKQKLSDVRSRLVGGATFARLAKQFSEDPNSAKNGGLLGWVSLDEMPPQFAKAIRDNKKGRVSKVFQTSEGFHVIEVLDRRKINNKERNERKRVEAMLKQKKFKKNLKSWLLDLRDSSYVKIIK